MADGRTELVKETGLILTEGRPADKGHDVAADPYPLGLPVEQRFRSKWLVEWKESERRFRLSLHIFAPVVGELHRVDDIAG